MGHRQKTVLVVDCNQTFAMFMSLLLRRLGFKVLMANTQDLAMRLLESDPVEALICEAQTPELDGFGLLQELRHTQTFSNLPFIAVATYPSEEIRKKLLAAGAAAFLSKPLTAAQLHKVLESLFQFREGVRQFPRASLNLKVEVEYDGSRHTRYMTSLSEGGGFIRSSSPLPTGTEVVIHFPCPDGTRMPLRGHVLYNRQIFDTPEYVDPGFAVHFRPLPLAQKEILRNFVEVQLTSDLEWEASDAKSETLNAS